MSAGTQRYYTISQISRDTKVPQHTLRYWQKRIPQLSPKYNEANRRVYTEVEMKLVYEINDLINKQGMTIDGVAALLDKRLHDKTEPSVSNDQIVRELQTILDDFYA